MTPKTPKPDKSVTDQPPSRSADPDELTRREVMNYAMMMGCWAENRDKPATEVMQMVQDWWQAGRDFEHAKIEKQVLLATVAKVHDDNNLFAATGHTNGNNKTPPPITDQMWFARYCQYRGDKYDLFLELLRTEVSTMDFKKELFPSPEKPVGEIMDELVRYGGDKWETRAYDLAFVCVRDQPKNEQKSLLSAIATGDWLKARPWLEANDRNRSCYFSLSHLLNTIKVLNQGSFPKRPHFPAILCREFIRLRELKISGVRAEAARKSVKQRLRRQPRKFRVK